MAVILTPETIVALKVTKKAVKAMNALFDADHIAIDHLHETVPAGEDWDDHLLDWMSSGMRETQESLYHEMNEHCRGLGFEIVFNRLYPRYEIREINPKTED